MSPADVVIMKLLPTQRQCAAHQRNWPKHWGCRVMRITPVSHRCSIGLSTAATCSQPIDDSKLYEMGLASSTPTGAAEDGRSSYLQPHARVASGYTARSWHDRQGCASPGLASHHQCSQLELEALSCSLHTVLASRSASASQGSSLLLPLDSKDFSTCVQWQALRLVTWQLDS